MIDKMIDITIKDLVLGNIYSPSFFLTLCILFGFGLLAFICIVIIGVIIYKISDCIDNKIDKRIKEKLKQYNKTNEVKNNERYKNNTRKKKT